MAKYRIVSKGNIVTIKSKLSFGEQINEREINIFEQQIFRGCFRPRQEGKKTIIYTEISHIFQHFQGGGFASA